VDWLAEIIVWLYREWIGQCFKLFYDTHTQRERERGTYILISINLVKIQDWQVSPMYGSNHGNHFKNGTKS